LMYEVTSKMAADIHTKGFKNPLSANFHNLRGVQADLESYLGAVAHPSNKFCRWP
jgi:hypothetical protein